MSLRLGDVKELICEGCKKSITHIVCAQINTISMIFDTGSVEYYFKCTQCKRKIFIVEIPESHYAVAKQVLDIEMPKT